MSASGQETLNKYWQLMESIAKNYCLDCLMKCNYCLDGYKCKDKINVSE